MNDNLQTIWDADPHTLAKHKILKAYLQAWMPILTRQAGKLPGGGASDGIIYVDGFAGPGIYKGNEPGSPIIAIEAATTHTVKFPVRVNFLFIEQDPARFASLKAQIEKIRPSLSSRGDVNLAEPRNGDCTTELLKVIGNIESRKKKFGPAMVFLDQFGYSEIPISLMERILRIPQCEVFSYLNWNYLSRFLSDPNKASGITEAFGSEVWKEAIPLQGKHRENKIFSEYKKALMTKAKARFVLDFGMYGENNQLLYRLFFCTNSIRGVEEMKKAMWKVDDTGSYQFSDRDDPNQMILLKSGTPSWLAGELRRRLVGHTISIEALKEYVLTETPCFKFKEALGELEKTGGLEVVRAKAGRRRYKYPDDDIQVRFVGTSSDALSKDGVGLRA